MRVFLGESGPTRSTCAVCRRPVGYAATEGLVNGRMRRVILVVDLLEEFTVIGSDPAEIVDARVHSCAAQLLVTAEGRCADGRRSS